MVAVSVKIVFNGKRYQIRFVWITVLFPKPGYTPTEETIQHELLHSNVNQWGLDSMRSITKARALYGCGDDAGLRWCRYLSQQAKFASAYNTYFDSVVNGRLWQLCDKLRFIGLPLKGLDPMLEDIIERFNPRFGGLHGLSEPRKGKTK
jgi:hypothetical protein